MRSIAEELIDRLIEDNSSASLVRKIEKQVIPKLSTLISKKIGAPVSKKNLVSNKVEMGGMTSFFGSTSIQAKGTTWSLPSWLITILPDGSISLNATGTPRQHTPDDPRLNKSLKQFVNSVVSAVKPGKISRGGPPRSLV